MYRLVAPLFLTCETPLHAGAGQDLGIVDLPIQRERVTSFPKVEASGLKGSLREQFAAVKQMPEAQVNVLFGPEELSDSTAHMAALGFTDARMLLFPMRSMKGVFAWVTCPDVLARLHRDLAWAAEQNANRALQALPSIPKAGTVTSSSILAHEDKMVVLDEYAVSVASDPDVDKWASWLREWVMPDEARKEAIVQRLVVVDNDTFRDLITFQTEVVTRVRIDNQKGTVQRGGLFTEEYLPTESVLYSLVMAAPPFVEERSLPDAASVMETFVAHLPKVFQLGGNATLGKGLVRTRILWREEEQVGGKDGSATCGPAPGESGV